MDNKEAYKQKIASREMKEQDNSNIIPSANTNNTPKTYGNVRLQLENYISLLSAKKLWAKEPIIQIIPKTEQKTFDNIWNNQNIQDKILFVTEQLASKNGRVYVVVKPDGEGGVYLQIAESGIHTERANQLYDVTIFTRVTAGSRLYTIAEYYKGGIVNTTITTEQDVDGKTQDVDVDIDEFNNEHNEDYTKTFAYTGSMPVILLENTSNYNGYGFPDLYNQDGNIELAQKLWDRIHWELSTNKNRIIVNATTDSGTGGQYRKTNAYETMVNDEIIVENNGLTLGDESRYTLQMSNLDVNSLMKPFFKQVDYIFEQAGYKRNSDDKGSVQQNDLEIQQVRDSEITSFTRKERTRQYFLTQIIKKMFETMGKPLKTEPIVEIKYMSVKNEVTIIDNVDKLLKNGLITKVDAIAKIDNISQVAAKKKYNEIKAEAQESMELAIGTQEADVEADVESEVSDEISQTNQ